MLKRLSRAIMTNSLWLVSIGLMLASSGLDGAYLTRIMPTDFFWLGYVLNTMADIGSEVLMYWFGRLRLFPKNSKRYRMAMLLLPAEILAIAYAWFFSWRQLLLILPTVEPEAVQWVAPVAAGFIPLLLAAIGYAQALIAGRIEETQAIAEATHKTHGDAQAAQEQTQAAKAIAGGNGHAALVCPYCGASANASGEPFRNQQAVSAHLRFCDAYHATQAEQIAVKTVQR